MTRRQFTTLLSSWPGDFVAAVLSLSRGLGVGCGIGRAFCSLFLYTSLSTKMAFVAAREGRLRRKTARLTF